MKKGFFRKGLVFGIIVLFIGTGFIPSTVGIKKEKTTLPSIRNGGYIQDLIDNANPGDTIYIPSGIYYENIVIDKSINLIGENKDSTIIDGNKKDDVIDINADSVKLNGFTVQHSSPHFEDGVGIRIDNSDNCIITNCKISQNGRFGILIWNSHNCHIFGNTISVAKTGINVEFDVFPQDYHQCIIEENIIKDTTFGIYIIRNRDVVKIWNNIIVDNSITGINTHNIFNSIKLRGNIISRNRFGVENSGHPQFRKHKFIISENIISSNSLYGILISHSGQTIIYMNNFENNSINAYFEIHNLRYFGTNKWNFLLKGNYWDDWFGSRPKIIPGNIWLSLGNIWTKKIPWNNYDWHPAKEPYDI
jgi:parallel beta-helix repeat protein